MAIPSKVQEVVFFRTSRLNNGPTLSHGRGAEGTLELNSTKHPFLYQLLSKSDMKKLQPLILWRKFRVQPHMHLPQRIQHRSRVLQRLALKLITGLMVRLRLKSPRLWQRGTSNGSSRSSSSNSLTSSRLWVLHPAQLPLTSRRRIIGNSRNCFSNRKPQLYQHQERGSLRIQVSLCSKEVNLNQLGFQRMLPRAQTDRRQDHSMLR